MSKKEISIFGTSFLDLLSGALGAVIILFVIVPKINTEQQDVLEQIESMNIHIDELDNLLEQAQNSIPHELYEQLEAQLEVLRNTAAQLSWEVAQLQQRLADSEQSRAEAQQRISELEEQVRQLAEDQHGPNDSKMFGLDAELGIVCQWKENADVDLHVENLDTGEECFYMNQHTPFGTLNEDIMSRTDDDDRYEFFYQHHIVPGRYRISVNLYGGSEIPANVSGYIIMRLAASREQRIPYDGITLQRIGETVVVVTLTVTQRSISLD